MQLYEDDSAFAPLYVRNPRAPYARRRRRPSPDRSRIGAASDWDISAAGDSDIQGFATDISANIGETVHFKIAAPNAIAGYRIDIYRLGYYSGAGATLVQTIAPSAAMPQTQPACLTSQFATTGLVDCGNWAESATWAVPSTAVSGIYVAKLTRPDNGHSSHIVFVVRDDARTADIVFQTSDTTWQAYNQYPGLSNGGASLYCGGPLDNSGSAYARSCATRAAKVSYNRPIDTRAHDPQSFLFNAEYPMVRWLEANGYDVKYQSGIDTDRRAADLVGAHKPKVFLSVGHDEYWSGNQRLAVENARNAGVNLAFLSGNEMYWKTRYEAGLDAAAAAYRTLVTYKETIANAKIDPAVDPATGKGIWTGTWRDPRFAATTDGGRPENGVIGQIFTVNCCSDRIKIPQAMGSLRLWANTGVSAVAPGDFYRTPEETLGYEWDEDLDNGSRPAGLIRLSSTTLDVAEKLIDFGANVAPATATHAMTMYRHNSGALVFGAGTVQWSWGLDGTHDRGVAPTAHNTDPAMQQATVNLLADMGAQPATLQAGLVAATKSADLFAPVSTIVSPASGAAALSGNRATITGTAVEQGGGIVAGVEVSVDGGTTWKAATGTTVWSFDWTPGAPGSATIKSRAIDDSGNLEAAGAGTTVSIAANDCPCTSIWRSGATPVVPGAADTNAVELGVQFKSDIDGFVTGIRFYKGVLNTGTHLGNLWSSAGARLATATFTNESNSGWQQVDFAVPVAITANTVYVASYHTNVGSYAADAGYFATTGVDSPPLHALPSTAQRPNGLFSYGTSSFPLNSFNATNYWVDVVFAPSLADSTPPAISAIKATTIDSARVTLTWATSEPATSRIDYGTDPAITTASISNLPPGTLTVTDANFAMTHSVALAGLTPNTTYYYLVTAIDRSGNATTVVAPTFTVPGPTLRDTASADFAAGSATGTYVAQTGDGELILAPTAATEFTGPELSPGWIEVPWSPDGYSIIVDGVLLVDGARVATCAIDTNGSCKPETTEATPSAVFTAPHSLEFTANFSGDRFQHAGLGQTFSSGAEPWAIFSTLNGGLLFARTNTGGGLFIDTGLGSGLLGAFHHYKIDWKADRVDYYVDGALVASHALAIAGTMRPVAASDFNPFGGTVFVDWMRMSPYASTGTFLSRIFDAAAPVVWNTIQWQATTPAGTAIAISVRGGNTAAPDATWSAFAPMTAGGPIALTSRYVQYRAVLTSSNPDVTPELADITISTGHAPVANADSAVVPENGNRVFPASGPGSLTANDTDADAGDILRVAAVTAAAHGAVALNDDGSVTYTPAANYSGADAFGYTVSDGLLTSSAAVSIDVRFGNIPPTAINDFYGVNEDAILAVPAANGVLANDTDVEHDALTAVLTALPAHGALVFGANGAFTYTPVANYAGPDSFRYKANDGGADSNEATVTIAVGQVNDPPIAEADLYTAVINQPLDVTATFNASLGRYVSGVLANDHDVEVEDTAPLHAQLVSGPAHGQLVFGADGGFSYVPNADFLGVDSFTYQAVDHFNAVGNTATVTVTVALKAVSAAVNAGTTVAIGSGGVDATDPLHSSVITPSAALVTIAQGVISASQAPSGYTFLNQQVNISILDPNGVDITASASNPIVLSFAIDHSLVPAGQDFSTFEMFRNGIRIPSCPGATTIPSANNDPCVTSRSGTPDGDVLLTIITSHASRWNMGMSSAAVGTAPLAANDGVYQADFQMPLIVGAPGILANDVGRSGLTASVVAGSAVNGTVQLTPSGAFTFTPAAAACGAAGFKYVASDESGAPSNIGTVSVVIDCRPRPVDDAATVLEDSGTTTISVLANDSDPDPGQTLSITSVTQPANGVSAVLSAMAVTYRPNANFAGTDSFTYTVSDGHGGSATATVTVTVTPVNDAPSFTKGADQAKAGNAGAQSVANWATNISAGPANEAGQLLNFIVTNSNNALFSVQPVVAPNGTLTYTPANVAGSATVTVSLHDNGGTANGGVDTSAPQTFTITITVTKTATTTTLTSSPNPSSSGSPVSLTAVVAAGAPTLVAPTGTVTFMDGAASLGSAALDASGKATLTISSLTVGSHSITAVYGGNATLGGSTSAVLTQSVTQGVNLSKVFTTVADFSGGTVGTTTYVSDTAGGEVILAPTIGTEFSGTALPTGWISTVLAAGGTTVVANGSMTIAGTSVLAPTTYGPGRTLEFAATFGGGNNQNVGLGLTTALIPPFAMFGTKTDGQFYARSVAPGQAFETPIPGSWFGVPHRFRIDYGTTTVTYWIDGVQKVVHTISYPAKSSSLRPAATDLTLDGSTVKVDWMRVTPYAATGSYTSAVFDAAKTATWVSLNWTATTPAGTTVAVKYRTGNTATPDATWTPFTTVPTAGGPLAGTSRYVQFMITETTSVPAQTPVVSDVTIVYR
jgi:hypothetical protein